MKGDCTCLTACLHISILLYRAGAVFDEEIDVARGSMVQIKKMLATYLLPTS